MLLSIPSRLGTRQQLLTPAEPGSLTPEMLLPVPRSGQAAPALPSLSSHRLCGSHPTTSALLPLLSWESHPGHRTVNQVRDQIQVKNKLS